MSFYKHVLNFDDTKELRLRKRVRRPPQRDAYLQVDKQIQGERPARELNLFEDTQDAQEGEEGEDRGRMEFGPYQPRRGGSPEDTEYRLYSLSG